MRGNTGATTIAAPPRLVGKVSALAFRACGWTILGVVLTVLVAWWSASEPTALQWPTGSRHFIHAGQGWSFRDLNEGARRDRVFEPLLALPRGAGEGELRRLMSLFAGNGAHSKSPGKTPVGSSTREITVADRDALDLGPHFDALTERTPPALVRIPAPGAADASYYALQKDKPRGLAVTLDRGWPMHALRCSCIISEQSGVTGLESIQAFEVPSDHGLPKLLPLEPIWPGFLADTAFFAVAAWLTVRLARLSFRGIRWLLGWNRSRRGHCPRCAYDLRGLSSPTCPECGTPRTTAQPTPVSTSREGSQGTLPLHFRQLPRASNSPILSFPLKGLPSPVARRPRTHPN